MILTLLIGVVCTVLFVLASSRVRRAPAEQVSLLGNDRQSEPNARDASIASFNWSDYASASSAARALQPALIHGDALAQCEMASLIVYCGDLESDRKRLLRLSEKIRSSGGSDAGGIRKMSEREAYCAGIKDGSSEFFELYQKSALGGNHHAQNVFLSGTLFIRGLSDRSEAERRYLDSAEEIALLAVQGGNRDAAFMLADAYAGRSESLGLVVAVKPDPARALALYEALSRDIRASSDPERGISKMVLDRRLSDLMRAHPGGLVSTADSGIGENWDVSGPILNMSNISNPMGGIVGNCQ